MSHKVRWLVGLLGVAVLVVASTLVRSSVSEPLAVRELTDAGACVWFKSDPAAGYHDDQRPFLYPLVADPLIGVHVPEDYVADLLLDRCERFSEPLRLFFEEGVSDGAVARIARAITDGRLDVSGVDSYADIATQTTLDALIEADPPVLLIGRPQLASCDLSSLAGTSRLRTLWLVEDDSTVADDPEAGALRSRYAADGFTSLAAASGLRELAICGCDVSDEMAAEIGRASSLELLMLFGCSISSEAIGGLGRALPETSIKVSP